MIGERSSIDDARHFTCEIRSQPVDIGVFSGQYCGKNMAPS
jgi:hypothetical protein